MEFANEEELICLRDDLLYFSGGDKIKDLRKGLCGNFNLNDILTRDQLRDTFELWDHFSGSYWYPIPATKKNLSPEWQYNTENKYQGEQLELRKDLAKHIADYIEKELLSYG